MGIEQMLVVVIPFPLCRNDDGSHTICFLVHLVVFHAILFYGGQQSLAFFRSCQGFAGHRINHLQ